MRIINNFQHSTFHAQLPMLIVACALLCTACHDEQPAGSSDSDLRAITAQSAHQPMSGELSRAVFVGNISANNPLLSRVITFNGTSATPALLDNINKVWCDGHFLFTTRAAVTAYDFTSTTTGTGKYPEAEAEMYDTYQLTGLYPSDSWTGEVASTSSTLTHAITGKDDIMTAPTQAVTKADILASQSPTLTFAHRLTKFEARAKAKDASAAAVWNRIVSIALVGIKDYPDAVPNTFGYTPDGTPESTYAYTFVGGEEDKKPLDFFAIEHSGTTILYQDEVYTGADSTIVVGEEASTVAYTLTAPFIPTDDSDVTVRVVAETHDGELRTFTLPVRVDTPADGATTAGYAYRLSLTFGTATISAIAESIDWKDSGWDTDFVVIPPPNLFYVEPLANCYIVNEKTTHSDTLALSTRQAIEGWEWMEAHGAVGGTNANTLKTLLADSTQWKVELLWCTWNTFPAAGFAFSRDRSTYKIFDPETNEETEDTVFVITGLDKVPAGHNAVIALKDKSGNIWWSWHLWFTTYTPTKTGATNGHVHTYIGDAFKAGGLYKHSVMMDRNLGATGLGTINRQPTVNDAPKWFGMLYQWGRKDPFTPSASTSTEENVGIGYVPLTNAVKIYNAKGQQIKTPGAWGSLTTDNSGATLHINSDYSVDGFPKATTEPRINRLIDATRRPYIYFFYGVQPRNWTTRNDHLWGGTATFSSKTPFDPCPAGWRVPKGGGSAADNPWSGLTIHYPFTYHGNTPDDPSASPRAGLTYYDPADNAYAWYPMSGGRSILAGMFYMVGNGGLIHCSAPDNDGCYSFAYHKDVIYAAFSMQTGFGLPVRCVSY